METARHFKFRSFKWRCDVWFHPDRVESTWDKWGLGVQKGSKTVLRDRLRPTLSETRTFGYKARGSFYRVGLLLLAALVIRLLAPEMWRTWAWLPVVLALPSLVVGIARLRKNAWLVLQTKEGAVALALDISAWPPAEVAAFRDYYAGWIRDRDLVPDAGPTGSDPSGA